MTEEMNKKVSGDMFVPVYDWESFDMATMASWDDDHFTADDDDVEKRRSDEGAPQHAETSKSKKTLGVRGQLLVALYFIALLQYL